MQTVVVPHDVNEFEVICEECLVERRPGGAVARVVSGRDRGRRAHRRRVLPRRPPGRGAAGRQGESARA